MLGRSGPRNTPVWLRCVAHLCSPPPSCDIEVARHGGSRQEFPPALERAPGQSQVPSLARPSLFIDKHLPEILAGSQIEMRPGTLNLVLPSTSQLEFEFPERRRSLSRQWRQYTSLFQNPTAPRMTNPRAMAQGRISRESWPSRREASPTGEMGMRPPEIRPLQDIHVD